MSSYQRDELNTHFQDTDIVPNLLIVTCTVQQMQDCSPKGLGISWKGVEIFELLFHVSARCGIFQQNNQQPHGAKGTHPTHWAKGPIHRVTVRARFLVLILCQIIKEMSQRSTSNHTDIVLDNSYISCIYTIYSQHLCDIFKLNQLRLPSFVNVQLIVF